MAVPDPPTSPLRPGPLAPVDRLLSCLPTSARLILLVVLLVVPAALANAAFARTITGQLAFSLAERDGLAVLDPALAAMAATAAGDKADLAAVGTAVSAQPQLQLDEQWRAVESAGRRLSAAPAAQAPTARTELVATLAELVTAAGNASNLILDPDLDSFYVMETLVVQIPRLVGTSTEAASPDGSQARTDRVAAQAVRAGAIAGAAKAIASNVETSLATTKDPALADRLEGLGKLVAAGTGLANGLTSALESPGPADPTAVGRAAASAVPGAVAALDGLLVARTGSLARERTLTLAVTLAALALAVWFAAGVWWRTRRDVSLVLGSVTAIADGDLAPRQVPEGKEEFGSIGRALTVARHQLNEAQTALTLSLAAREEQMTAHFQQQRVAEKQARDRAQSVIDGTAQTVITDLTDVVRQVDAVRTAASTIDGRVAAADKAARSVVDQAEAADRMVTALAESLARVADMAALIGGIADQTRLLALNATIESARAGHAGRGFSVVAQEVKNLAVTTARSTEQITQTIAALQHDAEGVATAITRMSEGIVGVDEATAVLANVATDQHTLVESLDRCVSEAMDRVHSMSRLSEKLERRHHERIPTVGDVRLKYRGRVVDARLADVSAGGVRCFVTAAAAPQAGDVIEAQLTLADGQLALPAHVVRAQPLGEDVQLGLDFQPLEPEPARRLAGHVATLRPSFGGTAQSTAAAPGLTSSAPHR